MITAVPVGAGKVVVGTRVIVSVEFPVAVAGMLLAFFAAGGGAAALLARVADQPDVTDLRKQTASL